MDNGDMDAHLTNQAIQEILVEMHQNQMDEPIKQYQWSRSKPPNKLNTHFLGRTIRSVLRHNERQRKSIHKKCRKKLKDLNKIKKHKSKEKKSKHQKKPRRKELDPGNLDLNTLSCNNHDKEEKEKFESSNNSKLDFFYESEVEPHLEYMKSYEELLSLKSQAFENELRNEIFDEDLSTTDILNETNSNGTHIESEGILTINLSSSDEESNDAFENSQCINTVNCIEIIDSDDDIEVIDFKKCKTKHKSNENISKNCSISNSSICSVSIDLTDI